MVSGSVLQLAKRFLRSVVRIRSLAVFICKDDRYEEKEAGNVPSFENVLLGFFKKWAIPGLFFYIFVFSIHSWQKTNVQYINKFCQWLDSNRGPLVSEATALPTEPQTLPCVLIFFFTYLLLQEMNKQVVQSFLNPHCRPNGFYWVSNAHGTSTEPTSCRSPTGSNQVRQGLTYFAREVWGVCGSTQVQTYLGQSTKFLIAFVGVLSC